MSISTQSKTLFYLQWAITILCCAFLIAPVVQSLMAGVTVNFFQGIKSGLTLRWVFEMWELYADTIFRSMFIGFMCLGVCLVAGGPAAYALARNPGRISRFLEELLVLPLAIPGLAIAMGLLLAYGELTMFRQSILFILTGHVIFCLPFMVRSVAAVLSMLDLKELDEGASSLGAGFWTRFKDIILPCAMPGILSGSLMVFTLSVGEFNLTWMLHTPLTKTLPVGLADSYASMRLEIGSAYTLAFFLMIIPVLVAMQWIAKPRQSRPLTTNSTLLKETPFMNRPLGYSASESFEGVAVSIRNCAKTFPDGTRALDPLDLEIEPGETLVFLGPSGCGKTTTLRLIAGLEHPDAGGGIVMDGQDVTADPIEKRNVGMVFQNYALFPNMTVLDNVGYGLRIRGLGKEERRAHAMRMLEMMRISELAERRIDQLSGGQRQRVALARALAVRPSVLLLDEPLTALDAKLRETLRVEIHMLLKSLGVTAVYVTHDQSEAMALGDRIAVMDKGRIVQIGAPREIYFNPAEQFVAEFIGVFNKVRAKSDASGLILAEKDNLPLHVLSNGDKKKHGDVELFFRPEDARICDGGSLTGKVASSMFLGDKVRVHVLLADGQMVKVDAPGKHMYEEGASVAIELETESAMVL